MFSFHSLQLTFACPDLSQFEKYDKEIQIENPFFYYLLWWQAKWKTLPHTLFCLWVTKLYSLDFWSLERHMPKCYIKKYKIFVFRVILIEIPCFKAHMSRKVYWIENTLISINDMGVIKISRLSYMPPCSLIRCSKF